MLKELDPLLHSELRLAIMSILVGVAEADFVFLKQSCGATAGNLSVQLSKLEQAGYIALKKEFQGKKPRTTCSITPLGSERFSIYVETLKSYLHL